MNSASVEIPPLSQASDPSSVYHPKSDVHKALSHRIRDAVRWIPEGEEGEEQHENVGFNCREWTPNRLPDEAYRHLHTLCISKVKER